MIGNSALLTLADLDTSRMVYYTLGEHTPSILSYFQDLIFHFVCYYSQALFDWNSFIADRNHSLPPNQD